MLNVIALLAAAVVTPVYTNSYTKGGVTYSQLGGIKSSNYVATAVSFEMPSNIVNSVNGKTGEVELDAKDVGSLPISGGTMTGKLTVSTGSDTTTGFRARMNDNDWVEYKSGNIHVRSGTISGTRIFTFPATGGILATREEPHIAVINGELHIITEHDTEAIYE